MVFFYYNGDYKKMYSLQSYRNSRVYIVHLGSFPPSPYPRDSFFSFAAGGRDKDAFLRAFYPIFKQFSLFPFPFLILFPQAAISYPLPSHNQSILHNFACSDE